MSQHVGLARSEVAATAARWMVAGGVALSMVWAFGCVPKVLHEGEDAAQDPGDRDESAEDADVSPPLQLGLGSACQAREECVSGYCVDGVCCDNACEGACRSCRLVGAEGTCAIAPEGTDPRESCVADNPSSCGLDGTCDGLGACRVYRPGAICAPARCVGNELHPALTCDGHGTCGGDTAASCAPYRCGASECLRSCANSDDCIDGKFCVNGSCGPKPLGTPCSGDSECDSDFCRQGVCCSTECTGTCYSCALAGLQGFCSMVPDGQDPLSQCIDQGAATCGTDGACNGEGKCRLYGAGTGCRASSCSGSTYTPASTCNGTGACITPEATSCGAYVCGGNNCLQSCSTHSQCVEPAACHSNSCVVTQVRAEHQSLDASSPTQHLRFMVRIVNYGEDAVPLNQLKLRYWFTCEDTSRAHAATCEPAAEGCANVVATISKLATPLTNADSYVELTFPASASQLSAADSTGDIQIDVSPAKPPAVSYDQMNDYSFAANASWTDNPNITVYRDDKLVWGTAPSAQ